VLGRNQAEENLLGKHSPTSLAHVPTDVSLNGFHPRADVGNPLPKNAG
jgi:hypothetical protein